MKVLSNKLVAFVLLVVILSSLGSFPGVTHAAVINKPTQLSPGEPAGAMHTAIPVSPINFTWTKNNVGASYVLYVRDITGYDDTVTGEGRLIIDALNVGDVNNYTWVGTSPNRKYRWQVDTLVDGVEIESEKMIIVTQSLAGSPTLAEIASHLFNIPLDQIDNPSSSIGANYDYNVFGQDPSNLEGYQGGHSGIDFQTKDVAGSLTANRTFYAVSEGVVTRAEENDNSIYKGTISIYNEDEDISVLYLHVRDVNANVFIGSEIKVGDALGIQGNYGVDSNENEHVHLEVRSGNKTSGSPIGASDSLNLNPELLITFNSHDELLPAPTLISPSNGQLEVSTTPPFSWSTVEGANYYWLTVADNPNKLPTTASATNAPNAVIGANGIGFAETSYKPASGVLNPGITYYWRVQAYHGINASKPDQQGELSDIYSFTTKANTSEPYNPGVDAVPPTVDNFLVTPSSISLGNHFTINYEVSDTGGSELKQVELWRAVDNNGDGQPDWPEDPEGYIKYKLISGDSHTGYFTDTPEFTGRYWYGIHVKDNEKNWNDQRNSKTGNSPTNFDPAERSVLPAQWNIVVDTSLNEGALTGEVTNIVAGGNSVSGDLILKNTTALWWKVYLSTIPPAGSVQLDTSNLLWDAQEGKYYFYIAPFGDSKNDAFPPLHPQVTFLQPGSIISFYGDRTIESGFEALMLQVVDITLISLTGNGIPISLTSNALTLLNTPPFANAAIALGEWPPDIWQLAEALTSITSNDLAQQQLQYLLSQMGINTTIQQIKNAFSVFKIAKLLITIFDLYTSQYADNVVFEAEGTNYKPLIADIKTSTRIGNAQLTVNFDASGSYSPGSSISLYEWSFGDSETGTGCATSHTYQQPGEYVATLTITDSLGKQDVAKREVVVLENHPPSTLGTDIIGQPIILNPDNEYSVTTIYTDPDGMNDLQYLYLRLNHPVKPVTMMWHEPGDWSAPWADEEGENYIRIIDVIATPVINGYQLTWTFSINDAWPSTGGTIDFGVFAWDDGGLQSGWKYDNTNATFDAGTTETILPVISDETESDISTSTVIITWNTDEPATGQVFYDTVSHVNAEDYHWQSTLDTTLSTNHDVSIIELIPNTTYHYRIKSADIYGNETVSVDYSFTTLESTGIGTPVVSSIEVSSATSTSAVISWQTDRSCTSLVAYDFTSRFNFVDYQWQSQYDEGLKTVHNITIDGLAPNKVYHFRVFSKDNESNEAISEDHFFITTPLPEINYSPFRLDFTAIKDGTNPTSQTINIWNAGFGTLEWTVSGDDPWLLVNPSTGSSTGEQDEVTVSVDISGIDVGIYESAIIITDPDAENDPRTIQVFLEILPSPSIGYAPFIANFGVIEGDPNPPGQILSIWNKGSGNLYWSVTADTGWIDLNPTTGSTSDEIDIISINVNTDNMDPGSYNGTITISIAGGITKNIPVCLHIYPLISTGIVYVSPDHPWLKEIQAGIDLASPGSTVFVAAGTYNESIKMKEGVRLVGEDKNTTIIIGKDPAYTVVGADSASISGFTIIGGFHGIDLGIYFDSSSPEISDNIITGSTFAITVGEGASPIICNNIITGTGDAILSYSASPLIFNNIIYKLTGDAINLYDGSNAVIINNTMDSIGSAGNRAVRINSVHDSAVIKNNIFVNINTVIHNPLKAALSLSYNNFYNVTGEYFDGDYYLSAGGEGDISAEPGFIDQTGADYHLNDLSPCIDAGDPHEEYDDLSLPPSMGTVRNDLGVFGGPRASILDEAPFVSVLSPNGGEKLEAGDYQNITWVATDDTAVIFVDISYSSDGASSFEPISSGESNDGVYSWEVPVNLLDSYLVKIVAHDNNGNTSEDTSDGTFSVVPNTGPQWAKDTVDNDGMAGLFTSLAFDLEGNPAVSYVENMNFDLRYAHWNGAEWIIETVDSSSMVLAPTSLAFDDSGRPAISYQDLTSSSLKFASYNGTGWDITILDNNDAGNGNSLAFDSQGNPAISYRGTNKLKYIHFNGEIWESSVIIDNICGTSTSLKFDVSGNPAISYCYSGLEYKLKYAHFNGVTWDKEIVDESVPFVGIENSLSFNSLGNPVIAYLDSSNEDLKYAQLNGSTWSIETIDSIGRVGLSPSLAFNKQGNPAICYSSWVDYDLKYAYFNGSEWIFEIIDSLGEVGDYSSIAFNEWGYPAISYYDTTNSSLKVARIMPSIDTTKPSTPIVIDGGDYSVDTTYLQAAWYSNDPDSGIAEYQYALGTLSNISEIIDWTSTGQNTQVSIDGLSLTAGENYYFRVKSRNGDGAWSDIGLSNGIIIDITPPEVSIAHQEVNIIGDNTPTIIGSAVDEYCAISAVHFRVDGDSWLPASPLDGTFNSNIENYVFTTFPLSDGIHMIETRSINAAGLVTSQEFYASVNLTIDTTSPFVVEVQPQNGNNTTSVANPISIKFNELMNRNSVEASFSIIPLVDGSLTWNGTLLTFIPHENLDYFTEYIVTLTTTAMDMARNHLQTNYVLSFSTISELPITIITNMGVMSNTKEAILSGTLDNLGNHTSVTVYFEYGLTNSYGTNTTQQTMIAPGEFNAVVTGLTPGATYHFRAVAIGSSTVYGDDATFIVPSMAIVRDLPLVVRKDTTFDVMINFTSPEDNFNTIKLFDFAPSGWTVQVDNGWCTPAAMNSSVTANRTDYIWSGHYNAGQEFTAVYKVTVPAIVPSGIYDFGTGTTEIPFGQLEYYIGETVYTAPLAGDYQVKVVQGTHIHGETREADGNIVPGVVVSTNTGVSAISDLVGMYEIEITATGTYTITADASGYRSEHRIINIMELSGSHTLDFKGDNSLVPNAPDLSYVLACINKWKFPPAGLGLNISKVLAVINAWKYPIVTDPNTPQYGGTLTLIRSTDIQAWNPLAVMAQGVDGVPGLQLEQILGIDFTKGPAGTGETNYLGGPESFEYIAGNLVESWETPEIGVWVLNVRQGVHFGYHPGFSASELVNGREMTAEDVAYSLEYMRDNPSQSALLEPTLMQNMTVERTGLWQVTVRTPVAPTTAYLWLMGGGGTQYVWPKEFLDTYGTSNNWYDVVGTGPYMIDDYVPGVGITFIRNNNYWDNNPVGPGTGDQLPYMDAVNYHIIPDYSTRLAALRTGVADCSTVDRLNKAELDTMIGINPDIQYSHSIIAPLQVSGRIDTNNPFSYVRVRKAMMLAIDHQAIASDLYDGQAELLDSPARKWYSSVYTPLDQLPEAVQELYGYNPSKAQQLLIEAGYPDGFRMNMILQNNPASEEAAAIIKAYWATVGIDVDLIIQEPSVFINTWVGRQSEDLILSSYPGGDAALYSRYGLGYFRGPNLFNMSHVNDPPGTDAVIEAAYETIQQNIMVNYPAADQAFKDVVPYILEQAFLIPMPTPWSFCVWQPWLKNYCGESDLKYWIKYAWIDQDLKYTMTVR